MMPDDAINTKLIPDYSQGWKELTFTADARAEPGLDIYQRPSGCVNGQQCLPHTSGSNAAATTATAISLLHCVSKNVHQVLHYTTAMTGLC